MEAGKPCPKCMLALGLDSTGDLESSSETRDTARLAPSHLPEAFGAYRPIAILGEGGMGIVYLAEQDEPIRRRVALKVIKLGMDTRHVIARFESERQALALMDHPHIAHVYDAGATPEGRPYFAMEYVPGTPITDYCDKHLLGPRERLDLFIQVCQAVHHAHQKGVIHRDIKPSNVLVMIRDGKPVPKIIDFGVAKATDRRLTEKTLFTELGVLIGTPAYMSPEQAGTTGVDVDTATDIYSLGVVLYELLVGALPFDPQALRRAGYEEVGRILREDEPPWPTVKLHTLGPTATEVARRRQMDVRSLERVLRGDLDWITMKALEKERTRRYPSASEFAADITRHLQSEMVVARPPSLAYRTSRFIRKHQAAVAATAVLFLMLASGAIVSTIFFFKSETARREAERQSYLANIAAADMELRSGAAAEARRRLGRTGPALRGWEWRHLFLKTDSSVAIVGGAGAVASVAFSADQARVLWISEYGVVHAADARTHRAIPSLTRPAGPFNDSSEPAYAVAIAPDGSRLLSSAWKSPRYPRMGGPGGGGFRVARAFHRPLPDDEVNALSLTNARSGAPLRRFLVPSMGVWNMPSTFLPRMIAAGRGFSIGEHGEIRDTRGAPLATMSGGGEAVSAAFSPDGRRLATWTWDNVLRVWDVESGAPVAALEGHEDGISSAAFSPDGTRLVSGSYDGTARIWTLGGTATVLAGHEGSVTAVEFAPDGLRVASGGSDKVVRLWDVTGKSLAALSGHDGRVTTIAFAPNGRELASGSDDRTIRLWDAESLRPRGILHGHTDAITSIAFSADSLRLVSGSLDQTLRFWEPAVARSDAVVATTQGEVWQVAISADSSRLAVAQHDGAVRIVTLSTPSPEITCSGQPYPAVVGHKNIAFTPDGSRLVSTSSRSVRVWDPANCSTLAVWTNDGNEAQDLAMSPDGRHFATGAWGPTLKIWDLASGQQIWHTDQTGRLRALAYSQDGAHLIVTAARDIRVWDADRHTLLQTLTGHDDDVNALAASPDGRWIASGSSDRTVRLWNAATGQAAATLTGHDAGVRAIAFSPDGTRLVSGGGDRVLRLWDVATHEPMLVLQGHQGSVTAVAFTPDGTRIVSGSEDGTVRVWESGLTRGPFAEPRGESPPELNRACWRVVKTAGLSPDAYELAFQRAVRANEAAPWNLEFIQTLGAAQYRVKQYDASLSTLARAARLRSPGEAGIREPVAFDLIFIAMAHRQLGHRDEARSALDRARTNLRVGQDNRPAAQDPDVQALFEEAAALIGQGTPTR
jgi:eukaryotic-like serine/threonine-protein kinase